MVAEVDTQQPRSSRTKELPEQGRPSRDHVGRCEAGESRWAAPGTWGSKREAPWGAGSSHQAAQGSWGSNLIDVNM